MSTIYGTEGELKMRPSNCHGFPIPLIYGEVKICVDLDSPQCTSFFNGNTSNPRKRADCLIYFKDDGGAVVEVKRTYMKKAKYQIEDTIKAMKQNWDKFVSAMGLSGDTPFPDKIILCIENGIGNDKRGYWIDKNNGNILKLKTKKGGNTNSTFKCEGLPIIVYDKAEINRMSKGWSVH